MRKITIEVIKDSIRVLNSSIESLYKNNKLYQDQIDRNNLNLKQYQAEINDLEADMNKKEN